MRVIKRNESEQDFCLDKIEKAIRKANDTVGKEDQMNDEAVQKVIATVQKKLTGFNSVKVEDIQDFVEQALVRHNKYAVAKSYILYRDSKKKNKKFTENEEKIIALIDGTSSLRGDNANKHIDDNASIRDYIAGIMCKSLANKTLPKDIIKAHNDGIIHWHDADYSPTQPLHNCFSPSQKFITDCGIRKFSDFVDGEKVIVKDYLGELREATVHVYAPQKLYNIEFVRKRGNGSRTVIATKDHKWLLADGTFTTDLSVGDKLWQNKACDIKQSIDTIEDARAWCMGFVVGDGVDHVIGKSPEPHTQCRLCGAKNKYAYIFEKAGYRMNTMSCGDMIPYTKYRTKQDFLNGKGWRYMTAKQKALLFEGLYAADGRTNQYSIQTSDTRVIQLIEECSGLAGYFITIKKEGYNTTNYKENRYYCYFHFLKPQVENNYWVVKSITPNRTGTPTTRVYCVTEPVTHTFTLENGIITGNCDIYDLENMFKYGFVMGDTLIEPNDETPFRTMVNLAAQVALLISGRQYGGQTMSWIHLVPYIDKSRKIIRKKVIEDFTEAGIELNDDKIDQITERKVREEIAEGVKIYQYQILCHSSANGQTPFVSNNLCLREAQTQRELDDFAILIEEILKRRTKGVKDPSGHYISPLFPKLLYWTCDGLNVKKGDPYYYLTELAAKCISKRMQPDIVSEPQTRKHKQGQIIPCMGCRSLLGPIWEERTYPVDTKFFWTEGGTYPYEKFLDERTFESLPNGEYKTGYDEGQYCINFRGNTGWLIKKTDTEVVVKQPMVYGRWNNGVITINLPYVALESREKGVDFYENLDQWLELCRKAMQERVKSCRKIKAKNSPILWMYGALARLEPEQTVGDLMDAHPTRPTVSLGYVGLYETVMALIGESNTTDNGRKLSKEIMKYLNDKLAQWKKEDSIMYAIYGTPEESLTYKFALALRKNFGLIPGITDKDYVVNSYHVDPREEIDAFKKLEIEGEYLALSAGGAVSYVETADLDHNPEAIIKIIQWMHDHIIYAEVNRKIGICKKCGYEGDIELVKTEDGNFKFICPNCGNDDDETLDVTARICGYLGKVNAGNTNKGRLDDIYNRVIHTDIDENKDAQE